MIHVNRVAELASVATTVGTTTTFTAAGAALKAGFSALAAQASVSLANNGGDIGKTLKELGSSNTVKNTLVAMSTAGAGTGIRPNL
jgi:filamentous hemagglutinin